jgi:hypothetical protein
MRQIMAQNVMANQMRRPVAERLQPVQRLVQRAALVNQRRLTAHSRKGKQPCRFGINLQIDGNTARQKMGGIKGQTSGIRIPMVKCGIQATDNPIAKIRKLKVLPQNLVVGIVTMVG